MLYFVKIYSPPLSIMQLRNIRSHNIEKKIKDRRSRLGGQRQTFHFTLEFAAETRNIRLSWSLLSSLYFQPVAWLKLDICSVQFHHWNVKLEKGKWPMLSHLTSFAAKAVVYGESGYFMHSSIGTGPCDTTNCPMAALRSKEHWSGSWVHCWVLVGWSVAVPLQPAGRSWPFLFSYLRRVEKRALTTQPAVPSSNRNIQRAVPYGRAIEKSVRENWALSLPTLDKRNYCVKVERI